jgi:hypothetical protein
VGRNARRRAEAEAREAARLAREQAERSSRRRTAVLAGGLVLLVLVVGTAYLVVQQRRVAALDDRMVAGTCERDSRADGTRGGGHVPSPTYAVDPPAGGDHLEEWARAGVYTGSDVPSDGLLVHSLEHGYVVVWARDASDARLAELAEEHEGDVIVVARPASPVPVAATAWGQRLLCQEVEPAALDAFVTRFVGKGPERVDRG